MTSDEAKQFAEHWVDAWNKHDLEEILSHYTGDFEMTTPMIQRLLGIATGTLRGKKAVGIGKQPFRRYLILDSPSSKWHPVSIPYPFYYNAVFGKKAIETFFFK